MSAALPDIKLLRSLYPDINDLGLELLDKLCSSVMRYNVTQGMNIVIIWNKIERSITLGSSQRLGPADVESLLPPTEHSGWRLEVSRTDAYDYQIQFLSEVQDPPVTFRSAAADPTDGPNQETGFLQGCVPNGALVVEPKQTRIIERTRDSESKSIATYALGGCSAIILVSSKTALIAHYPPPFDSCLESLISKLVHHRATNRLQGGRGFVITPGVYKQSASGTYDLVVQNEGHAERLEAIAARIWPGSELTRIPYSEDSLDEDDLQGIATVEFIGEGLPEIFFEGSQLL